MYKRKGLRNFVVLFPMKLVENPNRHYF